MNPRIPPWFHCPAPGWESARVRLPRPLTREEAIADLRWWDRQVRWGRDDPETGQPLTRMPGRARLVDEWGWDMHDRVHTPTKVKQLLTAKHLWTAPEKSQPGARKEPAGDSANADNEEKRASKKPAPVQRQSSDSGNEDEGEQSGEKSQQRASKEPGTRRNGTGHADNEAGKNTRERESSITIDPPTPRPTEDQLSQAVTPAERRLLQILTRWTQPNSGAPVRWSVDWGTVLGWWRKEILAREDYAPADFDEQLGRWDAYLERAADLHGKQGGGKTRFPKIWKNAIHTWIKNAVSYARRTGPTPTHRGSDDTRPRRTTRRRGQQGPASLFAGLKPRDAGGG